MIKFVVEKESVGENMKSKKAVMKGPSVVEELKEKLKLGRDVLKVCTSRCCKLSSTSINSYFGIFSASSG